MPTINAAKILAGRLPANISQIDRLRIESAIHDAYRIGFGAGADWQASQTNNTPLTGRL